MSLMPVCSGVGAVLQLLHVATLHLAVQLHVIQDVLHHVQTPVLQTVLLLQPTTVHLLVPQNVQLLLPVHLLVLLPVQLLLHVPLLVLQLVQLLLLLLAVHQLQLTAVLLLSAAKSSVTNAFSDGAKACEIAVAKSVAASRSTIAAVLQLQNAVHQLQLLVLQLVQLQPHVLQNVQHHVLLTVPLLAELATNQSDQGNAKSFVPKLDSLPTC